VASKFQAPRGTFDVLPAESQARGQIQAIASRLLDSAGYERIETPAFEYTDLFERGVGRSTDIVRKEMFTFDDKGKRSLTLRPEGTAPICRAYIEHGMHKLAQPVKLYYTGPFFRHERPQSGRHRQFHQIGIEAIGTDSPAADAEAIVLLDRLLKDLDVPGVALKIGSLGSPDARHVYVKRLAEYLRKWEADLPDGVSERIDLNPLRAFDSKDPRTKEIMAGAPTMIAALEGEDAEHFDAVCAHLDISGVSFTVDPTLVRGLDYYSRTTFSFVCEELGAVSEVGGGGRYDGLVEQLGGPSVGAVGWAVGVERILLAKGESVSQPKGDLYFVAGTNRDARQIAPAVADWLRWAGAATESDLAERGLRGQLKHANRIGAKWALILNEWTAGELRNMETGGQIEVDATELLQTGDPVGLLREWGQET
jgi:histidyl-tRNA synthetase